MTDTLGLSIAQDPPKEFIRGQNLNFYMELPATVPVGFFKGSGIETTVTAQLRKAQDASESGLICELLVQWTSAQCIELHFQNASDQPTDEWPIGLAEFDVVFSKAVTPQGGGDPEITTYRSLPVQFKIVDGVTHAI